MTRLFLLIAALSWAAGRPARAQEPGADKPEESGGETDEADLAKKIQNPVADLISIPFQDNIDYGIGPNQRAQNTLNIQPVIPVHLTEHWNLIMRIIVPVVSSPIVSQTTGGSNGLGDANPTFFLTPANAGTLIWGVGPTFLIPTATQTSLGSGKLSIGPSAVVLAQPKPWTIGVLANNVWSVAGYSDRSSVNRMLIQYFVNYNLPHAWYLASQPIIVADWKQPSGQRWLVPFGAGFGKIFKIGKLPFNGTLQAYGYAIKPDGGPDWQLRAQIALLLPTQKPPPPPAQEASR
jgi:hypothetical protein